MMMGWARALGELDDEDSNAPPVQLQRELRIHRYSSFMAKEMDSGFASISMIQIPSQGFSITLPLRPPLVPHVRKQQHTSNTSDLHNHSPDPGNATHSESGCARPLLSIQ